MTVSDPRYPEKQVAITGIGQSAVGRPSPHPALAFTMDAVLEAVADAGLKPSEIDGIGCYFGKLPHGGGIGAASTAEVQESLGIVPRWSSTASEGHAHMGVIFQAIQAIAAGLARHVLIFRSVAQAQAREKAKEATLLAGGIAGRVTGAAQWTVPFDALSPANMWALYAQAYFDRYGDGPEQLGAIAVNGRRMAAGNPNAVYRDPITIEDYLASRVISSPLRLYDCDTHIDGAVALVLSHVDAAEDLRNPPIRIEAMGMGTSSLSMGVHEGDFTYLPGADRAGEMLWQRTEARPGDMEFAQVYDGFSILAAMWLESMQLAPRGEALRVFEEGAIPLNTGGGQLSGGRWHGYGHTHEACVQLWERGGARQVPGARIGAVCNGGYGYGAMILRRD